MPQCNDNDCNDTLRELERFLDKELTDRTRQTIHSHLNGCPDCLQAFDFHAELKTVIAAKCHSDTMPPDLLLKIEQCFGDDFTSGDDFTADDSTTEEASPSRGFNVEADGGIR